jgi:DNA-binding Xre family transcriptional regulator
MMVRLDTLAKLCRVLKCQPKELLKFEPEND